jgi:hypothetical protein
MTRQETLMVLRVIETAHRLCKAVECFQNTRSLPPTMDNSNERTKIAAVKALLKPWVECNAALDEFRKRAGT